MFDTLKSNETNMQNRLCDSYVNGWHLKDSKRKYNVIKMWCLMCGIKMIIYGDSKPFSSFFLRWKYIKTQVPTHPDPPDPDSCWQNLIRHDFKRNGNKDVFFRAPKMFGTNFTLDRIEFSKLKFELNKKNAKMVFSCHFPHKWAFYWIKSLVKKKQSFT